MKPQILTTKRSGKITGWQAAIGQVSGSSSTSKAEAIEDCDRQVLAALDRLQVGPVEPFTLQRGAR